ncbi:hypothetical protein HC928_01345 [bacterium]|nr:hypothetical protein [bacterium]
MSRDVPAAMVVQLERVNMDPQRLLERAVEAEAQVARLRARLREAERRITALELGLPLERQTISTLDAAERTGLSRATCWRYAASGWWTGYQNDSGEWRIYANSRWFVNRQGKRGKQHDIK